MEVLVVISIIGLLSTVILIITVDARSKARIAKATADAKQLSTAIGLLLQATGNWPYGCDPSATVWGYFTIDAGQFTALSTAPVISYWTAGCDWSASEIAGWNGPYATTMPKDPWGNSYIFTPSHCDDAHRFVPAIFSMGPNGVINVTNPTCPDYPYGLDDIIIYVKN